MSFAGYVLRRLLHLVPLLFLLSLLTFLLAAAVPGDVAEMLVIGSGGQPTPEAVAAVRAQLGLDDPLPVRYLRWLAAAVRLDLGLSWQTREPVAAVLGRALPATLQLTGAALALGALLGLALGAAAAAAAGRLPDRLALLFTLLGKVVPDFLLAFALMYLLAVRWPLLPLQGYGTWRHLLLPALTLGAGAGAHLARIVRAALLEALGQRYVTVARAKGLTRARVLWRHALPNALLPAVTALGDSAAFLLGGTVIVENVFNWPGLGRVALQAIGARDLPLLQGYALLMAVLVVAVNLAVDLSYRWLDPRLRLGAGAGA